VLIQNRLKKEVKYEMKNGVVTLTGKVLSHPRRAEAAELAAGVSYVKQVVNELEVKNQRATSTKSPKQK
jgi:osmotically-inducible protein OsmY